MTRQMQYLISKLEEHNYVYFTTENSEETTLEDIFFAHSESINMFNTFPSILVMDSTYKTNFYQIQLFEIVGVTSSNMTYSVGFAFLSFEMLVGFLSSKLNMPKVVVTDRDNALMNVVAKVLPETNDILCYFHIGKNVKAKCITYCRIKPKSKDVKVDEKDVRKRRRRRQLMLLKNSPTKDSYASVVKWFKDVCKPFPKFLAYIETTILNTFKERFVTTWTDKVLHLGCRTTNIVELAHGKLTKYLRSSVGYLESCWDEIEFFLAIRLGEIQVSFGRSRTVLKHI